MKRQIIKAQPNQKQNHYQGAKVMRTTFFVLLLFIFFKIFANFSVVMEAN